jgi:NAD(P)-dependent dehydrogenase (short-subunit alcohol dehydrogenase family)
MTESVMVEQSSMSEAKHSRVAALFDLRDRVAIITGGAGLLGYHHGAILASAGARVVLLDLPTANPVARASQLTDEFGSESLGIACDITSESSLENARAHILEKFGRIDILINNAANNPKVEDGNTSWSRLENFPLDVWEADLRVGLTGAFLCSRLFGAEMAKRSHFECGVRPRSHRARSAPVSRGRSPGRSTTRQARDLLRS